MENIKVELEMDEMKLILSTKFMRNLISKIFGKAIYKKFGYQVDIQLNEIKAESYDGKTRFHINADAEINNEDLKSILKNKDLL